MFFLVRRCAGVESLGHVDRPGDVTNFFETSCYIFGKFNCIRKQHTVNMVKAVVKFSINIEYSHVKLLTLSPKTLTNSPKAAKKTSTARIRE